MSSRLPEYIFFDLDGTLLDSLPGIEFSVRVAFAACRLQPVHCNLGPMIGPPIRAILSQVGDIVEESSLDALEQAFRTSYDSEGWRKTCCFPEATRVLPTMREHGHRLLVVSNKPRHIALQILEKENLLEYFDAIVTRDSRVPAYTGKEEMIKTLLAAYSIDTQNCLLAGDTMEDANAAATTGIQFAYMTHGYGTVIDTPSVPVAHRLDNLSQFLRLMELVCD